jgi:hypothetical protein
MYYDEPSHYDVAQVCLNGHVINWSSQTYPQHNANFCKKCGAKTINACPKCDANIRGEYHAPGIISFSSAEAPPPSYCINCGAAYPWTKTKLDAANELVLELESLTEDEKKTLKDSLDDLVKDTPKTTLAATRFKKLAVKMGKESANSLRSILIDIISESAKKLIWPTP